MMPMRMPLSAPGLPLVIALAYGPVDMLDRGTVVKMSRGS
jgi:hypothetical protein